MIRFFVSFLFESFFTISLILEIQFCDLNSSSCLKIKKVYKKLTFFIFVYKISFVDFRF